MNRRDLTPAQRAFTVGAATLVSASHNDIANHFKGRITRSGVSRLVARTVQKAKDAGLPLSDPYLKMIVQIDTSDRQHREKESWQATRDGDFESVVPKIPISLFENVMYDAGYSRNDLGGSPR
ncbi:hypothetical protein K458DRAFT_437458 [Lentithecium fluviatile CBS 122367]|uniref:Uncharacterized protein n=1 Tax=Lentithecium fluviatile CBS 122367 TaxID=1168545 RepID=A0A6G1IDX2_9PLEO|nr:hypothetical protein K458DRAFT_437458 [Lentithecium fluviatile CBS 122367]